MAAQVCPKKSQITWPILGKKLVEKKGVDLACVLELGGFANGATTSGGERGGWGRQAEGAGPGAGGGCCFGSQGGGGAGKILPGGGRWVGSGWVGKP